MMETIRVGTRGSRLAIAQTEIALVALRKVHPHVRFEVIQISTKGDVDKRPLFTLDEKGIFEKEVNEAVKQGDVDFAVHSLKDIPSDLSDDLSVACIPKRASPNDVLVTDNGQKLKDLAPGSIVGTSSLRRAVQLTKTRPNLNVRPIRGNVETRVKKVISGEYDAAVLAERALLRKVEGGCRFPLGAVALTNDDKITLYASVFSADGKQSIHVKKIGRTSNPEELGTRVANMLVKQGAMDLAEGWRKAVDEWNKKL